jgi:hypothetical protein
MKIYVILIAMLLLKPLGAQMYDLETCETDIADNVPQFFQDYFQCVKARMSSSGNYVNLYFDSQPPYETWYYETEWPECTASSEHPNWIPFSGTDCEHGTTPGVITELDLVISIPVNPTVRPQIANGALLLDAEAVDGDVGTNDYEYPMSVIGSALNGVTMYNPCAAPGDQIENEAATFDLYNGHPTGPQMGDTYHYHTSSPGPLEVLAHKGITDSVLVDGELVPPTISSGWNSSTQIEVFGINCDGVIVMGCTELDGSAPNPQTWDAQNGHVHDMIGPGTNGTVYFQNRYHTHICYDDITDLDNDDMGLGEGNGYPDHEFTPEISYYETPGYAGLHNNTSNNRCMGLDAPVEEDDGWVLALDDDMMIPGEFALYNNYPNPFNPTTVLDYDIPENSFVNITIYDMTGRMVKTLVNSNQSAGFRSVVWDATNFVGQPVATGVYFYKIVAGDFVQMKKMVFVK